MTPEGWQRLKRLFEEAILLPPAELALFVERVRQENYALGEDLASLLNGHEQPTRTFDQPLVAWGPFEEQRQFSVGDTIGGRFRILRLLGKGGMGEVYEATDLELGQRVALKTIRPEIARDANALERFRKEVLLARRVLNPHVCRIHELFVLPGEEGRRTTAFFTMEFLEGRTLADRIRDEGALPWKQAEAIALQLCDGLQAIHDAGVIHRDLKTRNIILAARQGTTQAVIMDFGLARRARTTTAASGQSLSETGNSDIAGTPECMAPEQFEGGSVGFPSDIYAFGVVLYEMATGIQPFAAPSPIGTVVRRAKRPTPPSSIQRGLPRRWDSVIDRCLQYEPADRFRSPAEVAQALVRRSLSRANARQWAKAALAHPAKLAAGMVLAVSLVTGGSLWFSQHRYHPPVGVAARWYEEGVAALREGTYLKAVNALKQALASDSKFALAHARLADAYNELDYSSEAKDELLKASEVKQNLPNPEAQYLDAIRATVLHNFSTAVQLYAMIERELPASGKADGYVDLGRAYENVGDLPHAVANYKEAARIAPQYPAAFVRLGVLEGRQNHAAPAEEAFQNAEKLYEASSNYEGMAEVAYQRGAMYTANADYPRARELLMRAFELSRDLRNTPLAVQALCLLSAMETASLNYGEATKRARDAIKMAEDGGLGYWATEAQTRLASALAYQKGRLNDAADSAMRALSAAERNGWPLLAANARFALCVIRDRQSHSAEAIELAQSALTYYQSAGYFTESTRSLIMLIRAKTDRDEFTDAFKLSQQGLELERKSGSPPVMIQLEEAVGTVDLILEKFQDALGHFEMAETLARQNRNRLLNYEVTHTADALWRLGRFREAEEKLNSLAAEAKADSYLAKNVDLVIGAMRFSQRRYREVLEANRRVLALDPESVSPEVDIANSLANLALGSNEQAAALATRALAEAKAESDKFVTAEAEAGSARVELQRGFPRRAKILAEAAQSVFDEAGQWESAWLNLALLSQISSALAESGDARAYATKALDIISVFKHNCGAAAYGLYIARPDLKTAAQHLIAVTGKNSREVL